MAEPIRNLPASRASLTPKSDGPPPRGRLRRLWDGLLTGGASPQDAFCVTNRSWGQKLRLWLLVSIPMAVVLAVIGYAMLTPRRAADRSSTVPGLTETAVNTPLPPKQLSLPETSELQVTEAIIEKNGSSSYIVGALKNSAGRSFTGAELIFDLTDEAGSQVGAAATRTGAVPPRGTVPFRVSIPYEKAAYVIVREVRPSL